MQLLYLIENVQTRLISDKEQMNNFMQQNVQSVEL